jgi:pimeloyl-ACP methyl ester carboxylesterase
MRKLAPLLVLMLGLLVPQAVSAGEPQSQLRWQPCHEDAGAGFECATARVPLDYGRPHGRKISLALARIPAADPDARIGSLFLNPGGPGGSGVRFLLDVGPLLFTDEVRSRFDLVAFDPRGVAGSSPLICFESFEDSLAVLPPFAFPMTSDEEALVAQLDTQLNDACQRRGGPIIDHMATADVARDLDMLRRDVGDRRLSYVGYSYGSFLGVTYANLFPRRVRALVVDGVLDPIAWTTGRGAEAATTPFSTRVRSDAGTKATLDEFFRLCDAAGAGACSFAGQSARRFADLADQLRQAPIEITDPETGEVFPFTYADLIGSAMGAMFDSASWADFAQFLSAIEDAARPAALGKALRAVAQRSGVGMFRGARVPYENFVESFPGVACSDSVNPRGHAFWSQAGAAADAQFGYFGRAWTWPSSPCAVWEGFDEDRYLGPFTSATANPVLLVGNRFDPATRYEGAQLVHGLLPNSSLLTLQAWGHTSLLRSVCADGVVARYLVDGTTVPDGTTCPQDVAPFAAPAAARAADSVGARQRARAAAMSEMAVPAGR